MKYERIQHLVIWVSLFVSICITSCSQDGELTDFTVNKEEEQMKRSEYVYNMYLNCEMPDTTDNLTRSNTSWTDGSTVYLRFVDDAGYIIPGTAIYNASSSNWIVTTNSVLSTTSSWNSYTCYAYYFKNPDVITASQIALTEKTACYEGIGSYTLKENSDVYMTVTMNPKTWRLRFYGNTGNTITIQKHNNLNYYKSFNRTTGEFETTNKDVTLTVESSKFTPYVYGKFTNTYNSNEIMIVNSNELFYRYINGNTLSSKGSGYLNIPTTSNYSTNGWKMATATMDDTRFPYNGATKKIRITAPSSCSWYLSTSASWLTFSKTEGTGDAVVDVTAAANNYSSKKTATITCSLNGNSKNIEVTQGYKETLSYNQMRYASIAFTANKDDVLYYHYYFSGHSQQLRVWISGDTYEELVNINPGSYNYYSANNTRSHTFTNSGSFTFNVDYTIYEYTHYFDAYVSDVYVIHY